MKKNRIAIIVTLVLLAIAIGGIGIFAKSPPITVNVNGVALSFPIDPIMNNGRVLVPMRNIFESMGATVKWDNSSKTITSKKANTTITLKLGDTWAYVNTKKIKLDVPAATVQNNTMVPTRFIAESFHAKINWDSKKLIVDIKDYYDKLVISYIDVGQGDAILLSHDNDAMLIDAGDNKYGNTVVNYIKSEGIPNIDYLINTHPHADHLGGMDTVIDKIPVNKCIINDISYDSKSYRDVDKSLNAKKIARIAPKVGYTFTLGDAKCTILSPMEKSYDNINNYSIVIKVTHGLNSFLFMGDAESTIEQQLLSAGATPDIDVLKVGHHGSRTASTPEFLAKTTPIYAIISLGADNTYGHPHKESLANLVAQNVKIYRTDISGTITMLSDEKTINIIKQK